MSWWALSPRSTISDDYLAGASPQMSEDEDAAESNEDPTRQTCLSPRTPLPWYAAFVWSQKIARLFCTA